MEQRENVVTVLAHQPEDTVQGVAASSQPKDSHSQHEQITEAWVTLGEAHTDILTATDGLSKLAVLVINCEMETLEGELDMDSFAVFVRGIQEYQRDAAKKLKQAAAMLLELRMQAKEC